VKAEFSFAAIENGNREPTVPYAPIKNHRIELNSADKLSIKDDVNKFGIELGIMQTMIIGNKNIWKEKLTKDMLEHQKITDDLDLLLDILPPRISEVVRELDDSDNLLEVVMDLGAGLKRALFFVKLC
jgi:hypothetical protein